MMRIYTLYSSPDGSGNFEGRNNIIFLAKRATNPDSYRDLLDIENKLF